MNTSLFDHLLTGLQACERRRDLPLPEHGRISRHSAAYSVDLAEDGALDICLTTLGSGLVKMRRAASCGLLYVTDLTPEGRLLLQGLAGPSPIAALADLRKRFGERPASGKMPGRPSWIPQDPASADASNAIVDLATALCAAVACDHPDSSFAHAAISWNQDGSPSISLAADGAPDSLRVAESAYACAASWGPTSYLQESKTWQVWKGIVGGQDPSWTDPDGLTLDNETHVTVSLEDPVDVMRLIRAGTDAAARRGFSLENMIAST